MLLMLTHAVVGAILGFTPPGEAPGKPDCCCPAAGDRVWIVIENDRLVLLDGALSDSARAELSEEALVISCRKFQSEAAAGSGRAGIKVRCEDVQFLTSRGISGHAAQLAYDSASRRLELRGSDDQPVRLALSSGYENETNLVAGNLQIDLKASRFRLEDSGIVEVPVAICECPAGPCFTGGCCCTAKGPTPGWPVIETAPVERSKAPAGALQFDVFRALR